MKLARSTTFSPEKMLSLAIVFSVAINVSFLLGFYFAREICARAFPGSRRAFLLVLGCGAEAEEGSLERKPSLWLVSNPLFAASSANLTAIGALAKICFRMASARVIRSAARNDFVDEPDAIGLLRADHLSGQDELQGAALADQPRQPLRSAAARNESQRDFGLAKFRVLDGDPDGAGHRRLAAAAERKAIDGCDHRLAEILDEIEHLLSETAGLFGFDRRDMRELADVGAGDEGFVAGSGQDDAAHRGVVPRILEGRAQVLPGRRDSER